MFRTIRRAMESTPNRDIGTMFVVGGATALGGGIGGSLLPDSVYDAESLAAFNGMDKSSILNEMARSGKFSGEELVAASALNSDELMAYLSQLNNAYGVTGGILGGAAGLAGGLGLARALRNR